MASQGLSPATGIVQKALIAPWLPQHTSLMTTSSKACYEGTNQYKQCRADVVAFAKAKNMAVDVDSIFKRIRLVLLIGDQGHAQRTYVFKDKRLQNIRSTLSLLQWASDNDGSRPAATTDAEEIPTGDDEPAAPMAAAPVLCSAQTASSSKGISSSTARSKHGGADAACSDTTDAVVKVVAGRTAESVKAAPATSPSNQPVASTLLPGVGCTPAQTSLMLSGFLAGLALASGEDAEKDLEVAQAAMAEEDRPERYVDSQRQADAATQAIAALEAHQQPAGILAGPAQALAHQQPAGTLAGPAQAEAWRQELGVAEDERRAMQQDFVGVTAKTQDILQQQEQEQDPGEEDVVSD